MASHKKQFVLCFVDQSCLIPLANGDPLICGAVPSPSALDPYCVSSCRYGLDPSGNDGLFAFPDSTPDCECAPPPPRHLLVALSTLRLICVQTTDSAQICVRGTPYAFLDFATQDCLGALESVIRCPNDREPHANWTCSASNWVPIVASRATAKAVVQARESLIYSLRPMCYG